jgi:hypothetical protein
MNKYRVTYYYHAQGMEPDFKDFGVIVADSAETARSIVAKRYCENSGLTYFTKQFKELYNCMYGSLKAEGVS